MPTTPVKISKAEYAQKFGGLPSAPAASVKPKNAGKPIPISKAAYQARFGGIPAPKVKSTVGPDGIDHSIKGPNIYQRIGADYAGAAESIKKDITSGAEDIQAGGMGAVKGVVESGLRVAGDVAGAAIAPIVEAAAPIVNPIVHKIASIPGIKGGIDAISAWASKHPDAAKDIESVINIGTIGGGGAAEKTVADVAGKVSTGFGDALKAGGKAVEQSGDASAQVARKTFTEDLVRPKETAKVAIDELDRSKTVGKGILKKNVIELSPSERAAADAVNSIPEVSPKKSLRENHEIILSANEAEAENLKFKLKQNDILVNKNTLREGLNKLSSTISESPLLKGNSGREAIAYMKKLIEKSDSLGSSLLQVRKDFDAWAESQKTGVFEKDTAFSKVVRLVRDIPNRYLKENAVDDMQKKFVEESLNKQTALYDAAENLGPKASQEAKSAIGRFVDKLRDTASLKNVIGVDVFSRLPKSAQIAITSIGGTGYLIYRAGKLIVKPEIRVYLGRLLRQAGGVLSPEDRAIIESVVYPNKKPLQLPPASAEGRASTPIIAPANEEPAQAVKAQKVISPNPKTGKMQKTYRSGSGPTIYEQ